MSAAPGSKNITTAKKLMFTVLAKPCEKEVYLTVFNVHLKCTANLKGIFFKLCIYPGEKQVHLHNVHKVLYFRALIFDLIY